MFAFHFSILHRKQPSFELLISSFICSDRLPAASETSSPTSVLCASAASPTTVHIFLQFVQSSWTPAFSVSTGSARANPRSTDSKLNARAFHHQRVHSSRTTTSTMCIALALGAGAKALEKKQNGKKREQQEMQAPRPVCSSHGQRTPPQRVSVGRDYAPPPPKYDQAVA